jgi:hypothetical protein
MVPAPLAMSAKRTEDFRYSGAPDEVYLLYDFQRGRTVSKFKIGESVRLRSSAEAGRAVGGEYRIVRQLPQTDSIVRYRVRSAADEQDEVIAKESELSCWQNSTVRAPRSTR